MAKAACWRRVFPKRMKTLYADMRAGALTEKPFVQQNYGFLGGRGLIARTLTELCDPCCDALSGDNVLVFATTLFAGTQLSSCNRLSIGAKSPLTGTIKESNAGGTMAKALSDHGVKRIIITGVPDGDALYLLHIDADGHARLLDASAYRGMCNYAFCDAMRARFGSRVSVASVGVAGENRALAATVQVTEFQTGLPCRAAARGGIGAVMGSKGIKGIVVEPALHPTKPALADEDREEFKRLNRIVTNAILENPLTGTTMHESGSAAGIDVTGKMGALPVNNFSGKFSDRWHELDSAHWRENLLKNGGRGGIPCQPGCVVRCSNSYHDRKGGYLSAGIEYETLGLCGTNLGVYDPDVIAQFDRLCDDMGLDTIEIGAALGVAMEAGALAFGDASGAIALVRDLFQMDASALQLAVRNGCAAVGELLQAKRVPVAKRQAMAAYDPRVIKGYGMCFERSPMGADHTSGSALTFRGDLTPEQQADVALMQTCTCDNFMCLFPWAAVNYNPAAREAICRMAGLLAGVPQEDASLIDRLGAETLQMERAFNAAAGFGPDDDRLSDFFYTEPSEATGIPYVSPFTEGK